MRWIEGLGVVGRVGGGVGRRNVQMLVRRCTLERLRMGVDAGRYRQAGGAKPPAEAAIAATAAPIPLGSLTWHKAHAIRSQARERGM